MTKQKIFNAGADVESVSMPAPELAPTPAPEPAPVPALAFAALILGNAAIAFGPLLVRMADIGPIAAGFWRLALAVPFLAFLAYRAGFRPLAIPGRLLIFLILAGVVFGLDIVAWHLGIVRTKMANATLFGNCASIFLIAYGIFQARKLPSRLQGMAVLLAFCGSALLMGQSLELSRVNLIGDILSLIGGILYSGYLILMIRVRNTTESWGSLTLASVAAAPVLLVCAIIGGEQILPGNWTPVLILALSSQVAGQGLLTYALPHFSPLVIGLALLVQPALSAAVGWIAFQEILSPVDLLGGAMVMAALILARISGPAR